MFNDSTMLMGGGSASQTIGQAGQRGFGVGVFGGEKSSLTAMGLSEMIGTDDITSENYGNYQHTNGSIMVFIPAFRVRIGNAAAPTYSRDGQNALEIIDASEGREDEGFFLPRAFIDDGVEQQGFFIDKYLCSKDSSGNVAVSVKNGDPISLTSNTSYINSSDMTGCVGQLKDALTLASARGQYYNCISIFMWAALSFLSMAHAQAAVSTDGCAWYDSAHKTSFPRGNNNSLKDYHDSTVTFTKFSGSSSDSIAKTGSGVPFAMTTHNGQACGVTDVAGNLYQCTVGFAFGSETSCYLLKESASFRDIKAATYSDSTPFDASQPMQQMPGSSIRTVYWDKTKQAFYDGKGGGSQRALCGVVPYAGNTSSGNGDVFGLDGIYCYPGNYNGLSRAICVGGWCISGASAGLWFRSGSNYYWYFGNNYFGFRAAGYAP